MKFFSLKYDENSIPLDALKQRWFQAFCEIPINTNCGSVSDLLRKYQYIGQQNEEKRKEINKFFDDELNEKSLIAPIGTDGCGHVAGLELARWLETKGVEIKQNQRIGGKQSYAKGWYEQLAALERDALTGITETQAAPATYKAAEGITKEQVLTAFESLVKNINLKKALGNGTGLFGEGGARTQKGARGGGHAALWNPVILAFGLNERYSVPMLHLKRAFSDHLFLSKWADEWRDKLELSDE